MIATIATIATIVAALAALPASSPGDAPPAERGWEALRAGRTETAATLFAEADLPTGLVWTDLERDAWRSALARAERLEADASGRAAALGATLLRAGRIERAESVLERAVERDGDAADGRSLITLARIAAAAGQPRRAETLAERAVRAAPDDTHVLYRAASCVRDRERSTELLLRFRALYRGPADERTAAVEQTLARRRRAAGRELWRLRRRPDRVELPLRVLAGAEGAVRGLLLEARVGKRRKPLRLLLDSGASGVFVVERALRGSGVEWLADETAHGGGGRGRHALRSGIVPELALGALRFDDALVRAGPRELESTGRYHGVIGLDVFSGYVLTLRPMEATLTLEAEPGSPVVGPRFWWFAGQLVVRAAAADRPGLFLFDTGASRSLIAEPLARGLAGATLRRRTARGFGGAFDEAWELRGLPLTFCERESDGPFTATDLTRRSRLGGVEISGFIGLDLLARGPLRIDLIGQRIGCAPSRSSAARGAGQSGASAAARSRSARAASASPRR